LLSMASVVINVAKPDRCDTNFVDRTLDGLVGVRTREVTALLASSPNFSSTIQRHRIDADERLLNAASICLNGSPLYRGSTYTVPCAEPMCSVTLTNSWSACDSTVGTS
jgi:hypothetical protein